MLTGQFRIVTANLSTDRYFLAVSNWRKSPIFAKKQHLLEESNMVDKDKERDIYLPAQM